MPRRKQQSVEPRANADTFLFQEMARTKDKTVFANHFLTSGSGGRGFMQPSAALHSTRSSGKPLSPRHLPAPANPVVYRDSAGRNRDDYQRDHGIEKFW